MNNFDDLGYDSAISAILTDEPNRRRILRNTFRDSDGQLWYDKIPISVNQHQRTIYPQLNFGNLLRGNNDFAVKPSQISDAISTASEILHIDLEVGRLVGLHIAGTPQTEDEPTTYFPYIRTSPRYKLWRDGDSLYVNNRKANIKSDITRIFYPKNIIDEKTGEIIYRLRMEDRASRHLKTHLKLGGMFPLLLLTDLQDQRLFEASINWWKNDFQRFMLPVITQ